MSRNDTVQILGSHLYNDSAMDVFEREPFSVVIRSIQLGKECRDNIYIIYYIYIFILYIVFIELSQQLGQTLKKLLLL